MVSLNVDCCSVTAQDNEPRVTFTAQKFLSVAEETPVVCIIREHIPLSAVMQLIVTARQIGKLDIFVVLKLCRQLVISQTAVSEDFF